MKQVNTKTTELSTELYSGKDLHSFTVQASDGEIGQVSDFIFAPSDWVIRYFVIDTGNWLTGKKVVVPAAWIDQVEWDQQRVSVSITCQQVKESPTLDEIDEIDRAFEARLFDYYQRPAYWIKESKVDEASWESFPASDPPARW
ncbi:MAG: PRC-barrel domain-containing protein [Caldilineaceae bacterium]